MNEIKIYLKTSGSVAELYKDFNLYTGSYQNVLMSIYVPTSLLWTNEQGTYSNSVKVGALLTAPNGTKITTNAYYANYISEVTENDISYALYSLNLPKEFTTYSGTQTVVVNVVAIDNTNPSEPVVLQVTTSQTVGLTVLLSAYLSQDDILTPSEVEIINGQIEALQHDVSGLKSGTISAGTANYYQQSDGSQSSQTIEQALDNIPIVTANPQTAGTEELTALQVDNTVYNVPNMEISFGNEPDPTAFPLHTMTIDGDKFRFVGEKGDPRYPSNESDITAQTGTDTYISPSEVAFSVKTGLIAPDNANWTDEEKTAARATLGINTNTDLLNLVYPVGSVYMSFNNVSPATFFGGTWEQIKDTFLLAVGDTYTAGQSGGAATVQLQTNEMPAHLHAGRLAYGQSGYGVTIQPGETYALSGLIAILA